MTIALPAIAIVAATAVLGRSDLSRPQVVLGVVWFSCVAVAQLHLTEAEAKWPLGFSAVVFGGGLAFMAAAAVATGTRPARGAISAPRERYSARRMVLIALVLMAGAVAGWIYKAHQFGGIPLFSEHIDITRTRFRSATGEPTIPTWASALTGGFYLALWLLIAAAALRWRSIGITRRALLVALCALCLLGVALDASRNQVLLAVFVPLVGGYLLAPRPTRRGAALRAASVTLVLAVVVGGGFVARLAQPAPSSGADTFTEHAQRQNGRALRPLLPLYVNTVLPMDAYRELWGAFPDKAAWGRGAYSTESFPSAFFPSGKPHFGMVVSGQMGARKAPFWTVATYQSRAYGDFGAGGVLGASLLLGLLFGGAYRAGRAASGLWGAAIIGYVAYYTAFAAYDNLLSFTLIGVYDLAVLLAVQRVAERRLPPDVR